METDEYTISLSRELAVCRSKVRSFRRELERLEKKHGMTTESFLAASGPVAGPDAGLWRQHAEALARWLERQGQFEEIVRSFRS